MPKRCGGINMPPAADRGRTSHTAAAVRPVRAAHMAPAVRSVGVTHMAPAVSRG